MRVIVIEFLVGLLVRFDSYSSLDDRGRRFTDLGPYWLRREQSWEYPWPSVHRPRPLLTREETVAVGAQTLGRY